MNEFLRNFIMKTIEEMIEKDIEEWQVRQHALSWYSKGLITQDDLSSIDKKYIKKEETTETTEQVQDEEVIEETTEESEEI